MAEVVKLSTRSRSAVAIFPHVKPKEIMFRVQKRIVFTYTINNVNDNIRLDITRSFGVYKRVSGRFECNESILDKTSLISSSLIAYTVNTVQCTQQFIIITV